MEVVATEGAAPYKTAIDQYLPRAQHVPDRFHVIRWFGTGTDSAAIRNATLPAPTGMADQLQAAGNGRMTNSAAIKTATPLGFGSGVSGTITRPGGLRAEDGEVPSLPGRAE